MSYDEDFDLLRQIIPKKPITHMIGSVTAVVSGGSGVQVAWIGESDSGATYPTLDSYNPSVGDTAIAYPHGNTWLCVGTVNQLPGGNKTNAGGYFYQECNPTAQNIAASTATQCSGFTNSKLLGPYGDCISAGIFTAPRNGVYRFAWQCSFAGWTSGAKFQIWIADSAQALHWGFNESYPPVTGQVWLGTAASKWMTSGSKAAFFLQQTSATQRTIAEGLLTIESVPTPGM